MLKKYDSDIKLFKRLFNYVGPYKPLLYFGLFFTVFSAVLSSVRPLLISEMVNVFVSKIDIGKGEIEKIFWQFSGYLGPVDNIQLQLFIWTGFVLMLLVFESLCQFFTAYLGVVMGQSVIRDVRKRLYKHIQTFKLKYFDTTPNGTIVTRLVSDIEAIAEVFSLGLISIMGDLLKLSFIVGLMLYLNWVVTLLILILINEFKRI